MTAIAESFDKGDSTTLGPDLAWVEFTGDIVIISNKAATSAVGGIRRAYTTSQLATVDHYVYADVRVGSDSPGGYMGVFARKEANGTATFYEAILDPRADLCRLYRTVAGGRTLLASVAFTVANGGTYLLRLEITGGATPDLVVLVDGVSKITFTDSAAPITAGLNTGIHCSVTGGGDAYTWNNFAAGDLPEPVSKGGGGSSRTRSRGR